MLSGVPLWTISKSDYVHGYYDSERRGAVHSPYGYRWKGAEAHWDKVVTRAVAEGRIRPVDARDLGWKQPEQRRRVWRPLPPVLYHVTADVAGVFRRGLRSRHQLRLEKGTGLGGGPSGPISFTASLKHAKAIRETLVDLPRFLRGEISLATLERRARKSPSGGGRQWLGWFRFHFLTEAEKADFDRRHGVGGNGVHPSHTTFIRPKRIKLLEDGLVSKTACKPVREHPNFPTRGEDDFRRVGRPRTLSYGYRCALYARPARTEGELLHERYEAYRMWALYRRDAGGPEFPHFEGVDLAKVAVLRPHKVSLLAFEPCLGAHGDPWRGDQYLAEWQVYSNRAVHLIGVDGRKPPNGIHPSLLRCVAPR